MNHHISDRLPRCGWVYGKGQAPQPFLITATNPDGSATGYSAGASETFKAGEWFFELPTSDEDQVQWAELLGQP
jgi:hypothetical protein